MLTKVQSRTAKELTGQHSFQKFRSNIESLDNEKRKGR